MGNYGFSKGILTPSALNQLARALNGLTHGSVQIIVQDSKIIQIDKIEKFRLNKAKNKENSNK